MVMLMVACVHLLHLNNRHFNCKQASITGHSMGGHGALVLGLRHPELYRSISAFAPICNPINVPWGKKGAYHCLWMLVKLALYTCMCALCATNSLTFLSCTHPSPTLSTAFGGYLGDDTSLWKQYDACELAGAYTGPPRDLLIDTGTGDSFLEVQLQPHTLEAAVKSSSALSITSRMQEGYDHSYFFIATFMDDHVDHAAKYLLAA